MTYRYTDEQGVTHMVGGLDGVPEAFRDAAVAMSGDASGPAIVNAQPAPGASAAETLTDSISQGVTEAVRDVRNASSSSISGIGAGIGARCQSLPFVLGLGLASTVVVVLGTYICVHDRKARAMIIALLLATAYLILAVLYLKKYC